MLDYITSYLSDTVKVTPGQVGNVFWIVVYIFIVFGGVSVAVIAMNWLERKALAHFQIRLGPMRVGPHGSLEPIADALKLFTKKTSFPPLPTSLFSGSPIILCASFTTISVRPSARPTRLPT